MLRRERRRTFRLQYRQRARLSGRGRPGCHPEWHRDRPGLRISPVQQPGFFAIPTSVISIDNGAFEECTSLVSITIPTNTMASFGPEMAQGSWTRSGPEVDPNGRQWTRDGPKGPFRVHLGSTNDRMRAILVHFGSMDPRWTRDGPEMDPIGPEMDPIGPGMDPRWTRDGLGMYPFKDRYA